jgi:predicted NAD/FAD-binding protein
MGSERKNFLLPEIDAFENAAEADSIHLTGSKQVLSIFQSHFQMTLFSQDKWRTTVLPHLKSIAQETQLLRNHAMLGHG